MKKKALTVLLAAAAMFTGNSLSAGVRGKIDAGPTYVHVEVKRHGDTVNKADLYGLQTSGTFVVDSGCLKGFAVKPSLLWAVADKHLSQAGLALGWYIPFWEKFSVTPFVGGSIGYFRTNTDVPPAFLPRLKQGFHSRSANVGFDTTWKMSDKWTFTTSLAYAWSSTKTTFQGFGGLPAPQRTASKGIASATMVDYWLDDHWAINAAVAVNASRNKERDGMMVYGGRLGVGYLF